MKKYYCFYCQQHVVPEKRLFWRFCPQCQRRLTDSGEGFYKICDQCGANMPIDADCCPKCHYHIMQNQIIEHQINIRSPWLIWLIRSIAICLSILLAFGIIYLSFYLIFVLMVAGLAYFLFNLFFSVRRN